jgi:hypothetical protein
MVSRNLNPPWTKDDDDLLKNFVERRYSTVRASLKRLIASVRNQARKIGCPFRPHSAEARSPHCKIAGLPLKTAANAASMSRKPLISMVGAP